MRNDSAMTADQARRLLGVAPDATTEVIRGAYRVALKTAHPDHGGTDEQLRLTVDAYRILTESPAVSTRRHAPADEPRLSKLEITPVMSVVGGRAETRLQDGRRVAVTLPPGLRQGDRISLMGVVLSISIKGRADMFVSGDDLCMIIKTTAAVIRDGGRLQIKTPTGPRTIWAPKQAGTNGIIRIPGQGLPASGRHKQGSLILKLVAEKGAKESRMRMRLRKSPTDRQTA